MTVMALLHFTETALLNLMNDICIKSHSEFLNPFPRLKKHRTCTWASGGGRKGAHLRPPGFGHSVKYLVKIQSFCVKILKFGQNTNICAPLKKFAPP